MRNNLEEFAEDTERLGRIVQPLLHWYGSHARILPWREEPTPYRVWISEIMLQQTRVEAVKPYFERFLAALPTVAALAGAEEQVLLKLWEGLGYYNRVRNLQKAAKVVVDGYGGELPASFEQLKSLPGIGDYTAGAVASIAFGIPVPAVDGNVLRVISRVRASYEDITKQSVKLQIGELLQAVMPQDGAGEFNQSLMELGATVCLPNGSPKCMFCPLQDICEGHRQGITAEIPVKAPKKPRKKVKKTVLLLVCNQAAALSKRPESGLLAGLWEFPNREGTLTKKQAVQTIEAWGIIPIKVEKLPAAKHIFTHVEWHMTGYFIQVQKVPDATAFSWIDWEQIAGEYPIPSAFEAYWKAMTERIAGQ